MELTLVFPGARYEEMENRFKEQQLELFSDRTSTHTFAGNQLRL
jgi:hypothetical protein